jgi:hypothetical protein
VVCLAQPDLDFAADSEYQQSEVNEFRAVYALLEPKVAKAEA